MSITLKRGIVGNVVGSVWLAALVMTYERMKSNSSEEVIYFSQSEIRDVAQAFCYNKVHQPRIQQWCNGDHPQNQYNYLRSKGPLRRLTKLGEFGGSKEYPDHILESDDVVFSIEETGEEITFGELFNWFKNEYSKSKFVGDYSNQFSGNHFEPNVLENSTNKIVLIPEDLIKLGFNHIAIEFEKFGVENIFTGLNSTVNETILKPRYVKLRDLIQRKYVEYCDLSIGDFLLQLKSNNDPTYKYFLNPYGDGQYCKFKAILNEYSALKGLYAFTLAENVVYVGRCLDDFNTRINNGYGRISPKNCYLDGQATNCHINELINNVQGNVELWVLNLNENDDIIETERLMIKDFKPDWNIALKDLI